MHNASSLELVPGVSGDPGAIARGLTIGHPRPRNPVRSGSNRRWPAAIATGAILITGGVEAQTADPAAIERGRKLFTEQTFEGNGRTCATCHPPSNNFTVDPDYIRTLKGNDPLFLTGPGMPDLRPIEIRRFLRNHALFLENVDGLDQPGVLRSAPHTLALGLSLMPDDNVADEGITHATGWSGDGAPDDGSIRSFAKGAVIQHFTKSENRVPGVDFRLPTPQELDDLEAFQLSLGRQEEVDIAALSFTDDFVNTGKDLFVSAPARNGPGSCNFCHNNAGATSGGVNRNFATATNRVANAPACLLGFVAPYDGGFDTEPASTVARDVVCGKGPKGGPQAVSIYQGDMTMNTPPLIEAADTPPFFHNNSAATIEDAVAFYTSDIFNDSPAGDAGAGAFILSQDEIHQIAAFLRALNVLENIRSSNAYDARAADLAELAPRGELVDLAIAETTDAIEVLTNGPVELFPDTDAVQLLQEARALERQALDQDPPDADLLQEAIAAKEAARAEILDE